MNSRFQISRKLKIFGYKLAKETNSYDRFIATFMKGSLYVKDDYISATTGFKIVEKDVPRTTSDPKGNPEWRGQAVYKALNALEKLAPGNEGEKIKPSEEISEKVLQPTIENTVHIVQTPGANVDWNSTGVYIAYPTSPVLKPIYRGYTTRVNNQHTKVGIARDSFSVRKNSYMDTFDGEVVFQPVAVIKVEFLESTEQAILAKLCAQFRKVGRAREWFDTADREMFLRIIKEVIR